jgi:hypothetical protein
MYYQSRKDLMPWMKAGRWALGKPSRDPLSKKELNMLRQERRGLRNELKQQSTTPPEQRHSIGWFPGEPTPVGLESLPGENPLDQARKPTQSADNRLGEINDRIRKLTRRIQRGKTGREATGLIEMIEKGPGEFVPSEQPGYKYGFEEFIQKPLMQGAAAQGRFFSPGTTNALAQQAQGYASTMYDQFLSRYYQSLSPYQSLAGVGQTTGMALGQLGLGAGRFAGNALLQGGYGRAGGQMGGTNALLAMLAGLGNIGTNWASNYYGGQPGFRTDPDDPHPG